MFTGIIQAVGKIRRRESRGGDALLSITTGKLDLSDTAPGDSIAVNGVCLTAVTFFGDGFSADVSRETLSLTTLGALGPGSPVNLEKALTLSSPLGGHLVSGHADAQGRILERTDDARSVRFRIEAPAELARYIARKGSICVDGTSLTVNAVQEDSFEVNVVPHTLGQTIMGDYAPGTPVNLEVDLIARYLERLMMGGGGGLTLDKLRDCGFVNQ